MGSLREVNKHTPSVRDVRDSKLTNVASILDDGGEREMRSKSETEERFIDKDEEKNLQEYEFYHGFLPREDLPTLLRRQGDYLLRISEVQASDKMKREVILSVAAEVFKENAAADASKREVSTRSAMSARSGMSTRSGLDLSTKSSVRRKNVVVRRLNNKYLVEPDRKFASLGALVCYYQRNAAVINKMRFQLMNAIPLMEWEYLHSDVELGKLLGEGAFGEVRQGTLRRRGQKEIQVAVKLTKGTTDLGKAQIKELMREARFMRNLQHKNVVRFYGIAVVEQPLYIILELITGGALNSFLEKNKGKVDENEKLNMMCYGAAQGVEFLHRQNYIHRDLAARNCLYTDSKVIKISDFGLSRKGTTYVVKTGIKLPIRWLAPETISKLIFSHKTDVYSYGVIVYEIYADADLPWKGLTNTEAKNAVMNGQILELPKECPATLRDFITEKVFVQDPDRRASMTEIVTFLEAKLVKPELNPEETTSVKSCKSIKGPRNRNGKTASVLSTAELVKDTSRNVTSETPSQKTQSIGSDKSLKSNKSKKKRRGFHRTKPAKA